MSKLNDSTQKYLEMFHDPVFTEHEFVAILLPLLCKNGIHQINEKQLAKKLYYYYKNYNYKELFQEIGLTRGALDNQVDIQDGLYREKFFSGSIFWDSMRGEPLNLRYDPNIDLSHYEKNLSEDGRIKIRKIAEELSIQKKIEQHSKHPLYIYGGNPNQTYTLVHGKSLTDLLSFELITDGDISFIQYSETKGDGHYYYENPMYPDSYRTLKDNTVANVCLKNASFAIKQALCNDEIRYNVVNTEIINPEELEEIMNIANKKYDGNDYVLTQQEPYVRKLALR